jgi:type VI secretion system secreted protein VgrG
VELKTKKTLSRSYTPSDYEVFDYPGLYVQKSDGEQFAGVRIDEYGSQFEVSHGTTNSKGVSVGSLFTLQDFPRDDQNCEHLVVAANYDLEYAGYEGLPQGGGTHYRCTFTAMSSAQQFRPRRATPKPFVQGPQTAVVTGPAGDEIHTDKYGRVTVQFHWDRYGKKNQNSSCWIRVSHPWAGKNWGMVAIPRIGQEVIVAFLEGDPDQPIVTGRVYNAEQMPPYALPANKTQTGVKTRSSLNGSASNFNEIRFEDKKGSEQLFIHAEKNQDIEVEADETHSVGNNRKKTIGNDETTKVGANRTEEVGADETITISGNRTEDVSGNETITISGNRGETVSGNETIDIAGNRTETVAGNEGVTVSGNQDLTVSGSQSISVSGSEKETVSGSLSQTVTGGISITTPATMKITATGGLTITAVGGLKVVAPGGVKYIDFEFDKVGSLNRETYGMKFEAFSLKGEASGIAMATNGITMEASKLLNEKASAMVRKGAAQLVACDGPNVAKAGVAIASAACYLFK